MQLIDRHHLVQKFRLVSFSSVLLASSLASPVLFATEYSGARHDERQVTVSLENLNPDKPADARAILDKINSAASLACRRNETGDRLRERADFEKCVDQASSSAILAVNEKHDVDLKLIAGRIPSRTLAGK